MAPNMSAIHGRMVVVNGAQFAPETVPPGVDASTLPTVADWFDTHRTAPGGHTGGPGPADDAAPPAAPSAARPKRKRR